MKDYYSTEEDRKLKKRAECVHFYWRKICSTCGATLDSEYIHETEPVNEILI